MSINSYIPEAPVPRSTEARTSATDAAAATEHSNPQLDSFSRMLLAVMQAAHEHPEHVGPLILATPMLVPTDPLMKNGHHRLYDSHIAELLDRIVRDEDLTVPTAAEILVVCSHTSLRTPLNRSGYALYCAVFREVFPGHAITNEVAGDWWHHANRDGGEELRRTITRSMQTKIAASQVRGKRQIAAWRAEAGLPARRRAKPAVYIGTVQSGIVV